MRRRFIVVVLYSLYSYTQGRSDGGGYIGKYI